MYNFTFNIPTKIHFGKDTISSLSELKAYGSKVLLVYGGGSIKKNGDVYKRQACSSNDFCIVKESYRGTERDVQRKLGNPWSKEGFRA